LIVKIKQKAKKHHLLSTVPLQTTLTPLACADTGSNKILIRETDAVTANLTIAPSESPLSVQFPDGVIAQSTGIASIALPATNDVLPAHHIFPDTALTQSLFGIMDINNKGYDVTFSHDGLAVQYAGAPVY
jgi:hypothetical protein